MITLAAGPLDQPVGWLMAVTCVVWIGVGVVLTVRGGRRG